MTAPERKPPPLEVLTIDHVAIAVPDLDHAMSFFRDKYGAEVTAPKAVPEQGIRLAYAQFENARIELMQPLSDESPVGRFVARNPGGGLHHICLTTGDASVAYSAAADWGLRPLSEPVKGHHGHPLFFLHPKATLGALFEIEEMAAGAKRDSD